MEFKMCEECLKRYAEFVAQMHPPVVQVGSSSDCCGDPDDCYYAENGVCQEVED